ncbi:nuclear protein MDM1 isoform 2-T2 [Menidia menidia]
MTVRFKSEYQKSYGVSRSRSVSPQRSAPLAGLRSDHMGISREPCLQRRRRPGSVGAAQSCSSLLFPPDVQQQAVAHLRAPPAASRSRSAHRTKPAEDPKQPTAAPATSRPPGEPETPTGPRPAADAGPPQDPAADTRPVRPRPSQPENQSQPRTPDDGQRQPPTTKVDNVLLWKAGLRPEGHRSGGHRSEYHRQFGWKNPISAGSPLLTAEQVMYSSNRAVPPFKTDPVSMETEYRRNFQGVIPPTGTRLRKHLEHQRAPLFHTQKTNRKRREELQRRDRAQRAAAGSASPLRDTPPAPQGLRALRLLTEYQSSFRSPLCRNLNGGGASPHIALQVGELRQKAQSYRHRAWGTNFSRVHLGQLLSDHNALWEPTDTSGSPEPPQQDGLEALDLDSHSSRGGSAASGESSQTSRKQEGGAPTPPAEQRAAWGDEEEEEGTDDEEGRLPTPRLKTKPVQRTHLDLTTPATGGALLVGNLRSADDAPPKEQGGADTPPRPREAWAEKAPNPTSPSPPPKPSGTKQPAAPPPPVLLPQHVIQGTLRHPDFQHNGQLGLRFRGPACSGGGCCSDEDDRLSVMSWWSAASCSAAAAVLERAHKRRDHFWGKR